MTEAKKRHKPGPQERARIKASKEAARIKAEEQARSDAMLAEAEAKFRAAKASKKTTVSRVVVAADDDDDVVVRTPKKVKGAKRDKSGVVIGDKTMGRSYQRGGTVAGGLVIKGGGIQLTVTLIADQAEKLRALATKAGISMSEQVRRCVNVALA